ncbi:reverse transcriptase domain-containing protein [Tanacetum coccineum]
MKKLHQKLQAQLNAELEEEEKLAKQREEDANIAEWDNVQAMIDADYELAARLHAQEQEELAVEEKSKLFVELMDKRKKHFARLGAEEQRRKPTTKAQRRNQMCTYLKNMVGFTHMVKGDDDQEEAEMKKHMEIIVDEEEIAVDVIPLATKPPIILVKAKHGNTRPEEAYERVFWGDLKVMFKHDIESDVWRNLQGHKKKYLLTPATITAMLNKKLQADHWNEICYQLLKLMTKQVKNLRSGVNWKDNVELDGKIVKEDEEAVKRIKGEALKEKDDPGAFIFPIRLERQVKKNVLADTGSDINTMPYRIYEQLGREDMKKVDRGITMINHTQAEAMWILTNVLCQVEVTTLIAKFLILDILIDRDSPIVVGRGFLRTISGIVNTPERLFSTFDGFCHQTFRAARSDVMRNAESDSDDEEDYQIKRNKFGAPIYGPKPTPYLKCNDPVERSLAIKTITNLFRKISVWKKAVGFLDSLPVPLKNVNWKPGYKGSYTKEEEATGQWRTEIRLIDPYRNIYLQGFTTKKTDKKFVIPR